MRLPQVPNLTSGHLRPSHAVRLLTTATSARRHPTTLYLPDLLTDRHSGEKCRHRAKVVGSLNLGRSNSAALTFQITPFASLQERL